MYRPIHYYYPWYHLMPSSWSPNSWSYNWGPPYSHGSYSHSSYDGSLVLRDYGPQPAVVNINRATLQNHTYRTALWTGKHLQVTLMSIDVGDDIGLEVHPETDQFIRIEEGQGLVQMGARKEQVDFEQSVCDDDAIMIPAGTWHNVINTGYTPLKVYAIYAPPEHPFGTVHETKAIALASERNHT
ncbi:cupin domain-containing protein [Brevibacillus nitrificans]|uniref:cupin domain-containing protein n=1 Tax=Brevibacillus nitrificans TaxID=651560 RepID=UPI00261E9685|nr:cupin domain-containing protein [Brevibacillus nitrificans]MED1794685.1 cupin domain-containing protein [Brevibacillus nitrificans]